jgi:ribonuclease-3 family protein
MTNTTYSPLQLAYIGDSVYETLVRDYLLNKTNKKVNELQTKSLEFVTAKRQAHILNELIKENKLTEEELEIVKKGRNTKVNSKPKNCDILTYKYATALETLIGYLYYNNKERINEIFKEIVNIKE